MTIHLYAEHLVNIRTLSIQASLSTVSNKETKATLSADGSILTLTHEGESASIKLLINLSPNRKSNVILTIPAVPSRELTFRFQLEEKKGVTNGVLSNGAAVETDNVVPWTADLLSKETEIYCKSCGSVLVERGNVREWKNLPSEGWADMMDFWHCHKPEEGHEEGHAHLKKGYTSNSKIALEKGVGMVDATNFLLHVEDCKNITVDNTSQHTGSDPAILCNDCKTAIGHVDSATQGYRLKKLHISLSIGSGNSPIAFDADKWLACLLLDAMESQGVRKFVAYEHGLGANGSMKLWIFSPDLSVSSSVKSSTEYIKVAKVLWQDSSSPAGATEKLSGSVLAEGELRLSRGELDLLRSRLQQSSAILPEGARIFQEWHVGLLERFTLGDNGST